jgi:uncharacterized OsmC-like protein
VVGEVEKDEGVLVIRRILVTYHLKAAADDEEAVRRVHEFHADKCPVYKTIQGCVDVETELEIEFV